MERRRVLRIDRQARQRAPACVHEPVASHDGRIGRRRVLALVVPVVALGALAVPALDMQLALPGDSALSPETTQRQAYDLLSEGFGPGFNGPLTIATVLPRYAEQGDPWAGIADSVGTLDSLLILAKELGPAEKPPKGVGRRQSTMPLIEIARTKTKPEALQWLEVWKARYPDVAAKLEPVDVLVDGMRGRSSLWYRIRINLQHVPEAERPPQEELLADYNPWAGVTWTAE